MWPIKYIVELIYGDSAPNVLDSAVRFVIVLLVLVFDPLAILLVVSANMTWAQLRGEKISFASQPSVTEDFGIESDEIPEPEPSPPSAVDDAADVMSGVIDDTQLRKLDRATRTKLEWLIDKTKNGNTT